MRGHEEQGGTMVLRADHDWGWLNVDLPESPTREISGETSAHAAVAIIRLGLARIRWNRCPALSFLRSTNEFLEEGTHGDDHDRSVDQEKVEEVHDHNRQGLQVGYRVSKGIGKQLHSNQRQDKDPDEH